jgi:chromosomal replication initiator protein
MSDGEHSYLEFWKETVSRVRETLPEQEYNTWFNRLSYLRSEERKVVLAGASQFILDTVISRYRDLLVNTLSELTGEEIVVEFEVAARPSPAAQESHTEVASQAKKAQIKQSITAQKSAKMRSESNLNASYEFTNFVIGDNIAFA